MFLSCVKMIQWLQGVKAPWLIPRGQSRNQGKKNPRRQGLEEIVKNWNKKNQEEGKD